MKIYVVGSSKNKFLPLDNIREKFLIDQPHEGDNIDFLNPWYCELTGLYYLWKHVDDEIVGLEHYRRYFVNEKGNLLSEGEIRETLKKYDIITLYNSKHSGIKFGFTKDNFKVMPYILACITIKNENFGKFCKNYVLTPGLYACNMFICKKELINEYCEWIFNEVLLKYDNFSISRSHGWIAEMLFGAWIEYKKLKTKKQIVLIDNKLYRNF